MSQETDDILRGLAQAAADAFDGALDEKGEHIKIGLKREEGHSVYDSRIPDGFKIKIDGNNCVVLYQSDIKLKDVHNSKFENELERTMASIASFLKKRYKQITGKALTLTAQGDVDALVQSTSRVRVWVQATKVYKIGGLGDVEDRLEPSNDRIDAKFREFLELGGWGKRPKNKHQRG